MTYASKKAIRESSGLSLPEVAAAHIFAELSEGRVPWQVGIGSMGCPVSLAGREFRGFNRLVLSGRGECEVWDSFKAFKHFGAKVKQGHGGTASTRFSGGKPCLHSVWNLGDSDARLSDYYWEFIGDHRFGCERRSEFVGLPDLVVPLRACHEVSAGKTISDPKIFRGLVVELVRGFLLWDSAAGCEDSVQGMPAGLWEAYLGEKPWRLFVAANKAQKVYELWRDSLGVEGVA